MPQGEDRDDRLDAAGRAEQVPDGSLVGGDRERGGARAEEILDGLRLGEVVGTGTGAVGVDVVDVTGCQPGAGDRRAHDLGAAGGARRRGGHVEAVVAGRPAAEFRQRLAAAGCADVRAFQHEGAGALAEERAGAVEVEGPDAVAGHRTQRAESAPGAAREGVVAGDQQAPGAAGAQEGGGMGQRGGAGGARERERDRGAVQSQGGGQPPGRQRLGAGLERRGRSLAGQGALALVERAEVAGGDESGLRGVAAGLREGLGAGAQGEAGGEIEPRQWVGRGRGRVVADLASLDAGDAAQVEAVDRGDPRLGHQQPLPEPVNRGAVGRHGAHAGDEDAFGRHQGRPFMQRPPSTQSTCPVT